MPGPAGGTVAYVDDDVVAVIAPDLPGVLVAPRSHAAAMDQRPGALLAALRKAALHVEDAYDRSGVTIERVADLPGAPGHACYRVVPGTVDEAPPPREGDRALDAYRLAALLAAPDPGPPGRSPTLPVPPAQDRDG